MQGAFSFHFQNVYSNNFSQSLWFFSAAVSNIWSAANEQFSQARLIMETRVASNLQKLFTFIKIGKLLFILMLGLDPIKWWNKRHSKKATKCTKSKLLSNFILEEYAYRVTSRSFELANRYLWITNKILFSWITFT